ncbi:hypothetical protein M4R23_08955 [Acidovorax sp. GBBC 3332]|nr:MULTISPECIES: hypothetical protein [unclassified Acidovorax]MDA8449811.1 hypothetical protein [Acidovorax sp. GBBC 3297]MDA8459256.1 hypothetical protein [Acidovorax sp. GBBC 3333]MDA8464293.1 hypothetical protein [Acidovorax sp. GBBC 3332]MDA8469497.1 hypothetical protein [Acidovorax sp. GBBC 3299]
MCSNRIQPEVAALRRIARRIVPEAFGPAFPHRVHALRAVNHLFSVMPVGDGLELTIDAYSALLRPAAHEFDGVRFETMVIAFETAGACRASYHHLHRLARTILGGLSVLADGQMIERARAARRIRWSTS